MVGMRNFQGTFETRKRSFISAFSISLAVSLRFDSVLNKRSMINTFNIDNSNIVKLRHNIVKLWQPLQMEI